jgi:hypothetical protein
MKKIFSLTNAVLALALIAGAICISSFRQDKTAVPDSFRTNSEGDEDTTPPRKRNRDADELRIDRLEEAMKKLDVEMSKLNEKLKNIDYNKIQRDVDASLKKVDFDKIAKDVEASVKKTDWKKMEREMKASMEKVRNIDMVKMKEQLAKAKVQMEKHQKAMKLNSEEFKGKIANAMEKAKASMEKAREEMQNMKSFTDALEKDKLIDKSKTYDIKVENGELYIDGKKQPKEVNDKYKEYYKKDNFHISNGHKNDGWI